MRQATVLRVARCIGAALLASAIAAPAIAQRENTAQRLLARDLPGFFGPVAIGEQHRSDRLIVLRSS